jgi:hypothetical protein
VARIFVVAAVVAAFALPAAAETLTLPAGSPIRGQIAGACPTCLDAGFFACVAFDHVAGGSTLTREAPAGRVAYYCLTDGCGFLR